MAENKSEKDTHQPVPGEEFTGYKRVLLPKFKILEELDYGDKTPYVGVRFSDNEEYTKLTKQLFKKGDKLVIKPTQQKVVDGKLVSKFSAVIESDDVNYDLGLFDSLDDLFCTVNMAQNSTLRFVNIHPEILKEHENRLALAARLMEGTNLELVIEYNKFKFGVPSPCFSACYSGIANPYRSNQVYKFADPERMAYITTLSILGADDVCSLMQNAFANAVMINGRFHGGNKLVDINRHQMESRMLRYAPNTGLISVIPSTYLGKIFSFYNGDIIAEPYTYEKELEYINSISAGSPLFQIDSQIYNPNDEKQYAALQKLIAMQNESNKGRQPE